MIFLKNKKPFALLGVLLLIFSVSCVDNDFQAPDEIKLEPLPSNTATISIADLKALHKDKSDQEIVEIADGTVIVGEVISSDKAGNIYKELYLQDATGGILVRIDASVLYTEYALGQQIALDCSQLVIGSYGGNKQLGIASVYNDEPAAGRIPAPLAQAYIRKGTISQELAIKTATVEEIFENLDAWVGHRVKIENLKVAESDRGKTYADAEKQLTQNRYFNDGTSSKDIVLRTSGYADFAGDKLPEGSGTVVAILSRFRNTPQLYINSPADMIDFKDDDGEPGTGGDVIFFEDFEDWTDGEINEPDWSNISTLGSSTWKKEGNAGHYAAFSPYGSGDSESEGWMILPKLSGEDLHIQFRMAVGYMVAGHDDVLRLKVSTDFDGTNVASASWVDLTDKVNLPADIGNPSGDFWQWEGSDVDLSQFEGEISIAFVYKGSSTQSTKVEIDNIKVISGGFKDNPGPDPDPDNYYQSAEGKSGYALKTALYQIVSSNTEQLSYGDLWDAYTTTDRQKDNPNLVWDMYSYNPDGAPAYTYTFITDQCGQFSGEGSCYNREHSFPKSWFGGKVYPMYTDLIQVVPSDGYVNTRRNNYPYGEVSTANWTSTNGAKLGPNATGGYSGTVFEPIDEYKGDFARIYFYMATRYENKIASWEKNTNHSDAVLDGTSNHVFENWQLALLLKWHQQDPVSPKEQNRNEAVYQLQKNRNPFVDHPEYVSSIWEN
ncbi:endonuclease [Rapidithrix thailandica]|uniref:Endonuclease n=1 Tax=Rapidithrix thailandica TaxID=413964 RepID=A0AAW9SL01_9BACT